MVFDKVGCSFALNATWKVLAGESGSIVQSLQQLVARRGCKWKGGVVGVLGLVGWLKQLERTQSAWIGNNDVDDGGGRHLLWS